jgi:hypothetical protein
MSYIFSTSHYILQGIQFISQEDISCCATEANPCHHPLCLKRLLLLSSKSHEQFIRHSDTSFVRFLYDRRRRQKQIANLRNAATAIEALYRRLEEEPEEEQSSG